MSEPDQKGRRGEGEKGSALESSHLPISPSTHLPFSQGGSDRVFWIGLTILGGSYVFLIVAMLVADLFYTSPRQLLEPLEKEQIRFAIKLSLISCTITTILSLWVAVPMGYLLSRTKFPGKNVVDTILDIPIVLPPLVIGLSLLILFRTDPGQRIEEWSRNEIGFALIYVLMPLVFSGLLCLFLPVRGRRRWLAFAGTTAATVAMLALTSLGPSWSHELTRRLGTSITFAVPSVIIAQFSVACAFAVRTMRVTFDQISPRTEQVALTLGCSRSQAFWQVTLPQARRGMLSAATLAWARSLGEFGPILVFSGATRMRTEVLSTTVFLELSIGKLEAAIAVSLLMVLVAVVVLVLTRMFGLRGTGVI
jgi:molybdate transport system permease protein